VPNRFALRIPTLSFQTVVTFWMSGILYLTLLLAGFFFVRIYSAEKISSAYELELSNTAQFSSHLETLLLNSSHLDTKQLQSSREIIFAKDDPCGAPSPPPSSMASPGIGTTPVVSPVLISETFSKSLEASRFSVSDILSSPELAQACQKITKDAFSFVASSQKYIFPYMLVLTPSVAGAPFRLLMISMDGLGGANSIGYQALLSDSGDLLWSSKDETSPDQLSLLKDQAARTIASNLPGLRRVDRGVFFSFAPILGKMVLFSLGSQSTIDQAVSNLQMEIIWLLLGASFLIILLARRVLERLSVPLTRLQEAAGRLARGDFQSRIEVAGDVEFRVVQNTFNRMADELVRLMEVARQTSKLESELELAKEVQEILFPKNHLEVGSFEIRSRIKNAESCGGDWWGCIDVDSTPGRSKLVLMIGDVTGHGAPAALVTAAAQGSMSVISTWIKQNPGLVEDPRQILNLFNNAVYRSSAGNLAMSFLVVVIDEAAQSITVSNAGHNWPYLFTRDADGSMQIKAIGAASPVLGTEADQKFEHKETFPWSAGSTLFLYTDGLIDCYKDDKNLFDKRDLVRVLRSNLGQNSKTILSELMKDRDAKTLGLPPADDVTVVICSRKEGA
jgi:serine phosphatase RsbU (regulator of sigma subunit)